MKRCLKIVGLFLLIQGCTEVTKVGYVESDRLLAEYDKTQIAAKDIEKNTAEIRGQFDTLKAAFEQMQEEFTKKMDVYSETERSQAELNLNRKQGDLQKYYEILTNKIQEEDQNVTKVLLKEIDKVVKAYGEKNNYEMIFGATSTGNVVYAKEATNLTDEIIQLLNE